MSLLWILISECWLTARLWGVAVRDPACLFSHLLPQVESGGGEGGFWWTWREVRPIALVCVWFLPFYISSQLPHPYPKCSLAHLLPWASKSPSPWLRTYSSVCGLFDNTVLLIGALYPSFISDFPAIWPVLGPFWALNKFMWREWNQQPLGTSLVVQWLRLHLPMKRGVGSIPGWGVKIPHALWLKKQNIKQKQYCNKFNKELKNGPH